MALTSATQALTRQAHAHPPSAEVTKAVQVASASTGVDFSYLLAKAAVESNYDPNAKAGTSNATGLFQFIDTTWISMIRDHGAEHGYGDYAKAIQSGNLSPQMRRDILNLRYDPTASATMAAEYTKDNKEVLEHTVGGDLDNADLYLAHFLGAGGATKFLKAMHANPDQSAAPLFPAAARANKNVFYTSGRPCTLAEIRDKFADKLKAYADASSDVAPTSSGRLLDSLYFPTLASAPSAQPSPAQPAAMQQAVMQRAAAQAQSGPACSIGDWAFLRPTGGGQPLLATANSTGLPSNLSYSVQMALARLDAPGAARGANP